jgi:hypothetical protein
MLGSPTVFLNIRIAHFQATIFQKCKCKNGFYDFADFISKTGEKFIRRAKPQTVKTMPIST